LTRFFPAAADIDVMPSPARTTHSSKVLQRWFLMYSRLDFMIFSLQRPAVGFRVRHHLAVVVSRNLCEGLSVSSAIIHRQGLPDL
jgi:hypothetical protein